MRIDTSLRALAHGLALLLMGLVTSCINLDSFLYAPTQAAADADLFAEAKLIPDELKTEIKTGITTQDGVNISAWALTHDSNNIADTTFKGRHRTGVLYCHGNNQNLSRFALRAQTLWAMGYTVLAFDYRGYGKTPGVPSEEGTYLDGRAARAFLTDPDVGLGLDAARVALYGYSLGAAVCSQLAVEAPTAALVLEAPFASVASLVGDDTALGLPQVGFTRARYDTTGKIAAYTGGLLVMHGTADHYLMVRYGREVAEAALAARPRLFVPVPGADHETVRCGVKDRRSANPGDCLGGVDPNYIIWVSQLIDGAIAPLDDGA